MLCTLNLYRNFLWLSYVTITHLALPIPVDFFPVGFKEAYVIAILHISYRMNQTFPLSLSDASGHYKIYLVRLIGHAYTSCFLSFPPHVN